MNILSCPRCSKPLSPARSPNGLLQVCTGCGGRMVPLAVLRRDKATENFTREVWRGARASGRGPRACPHCRRPMAVATVGAPDGGRPVELDVCRPCQSVWFDRAEYPAVRDEVAAEPQEKDISPRAREAAAMLALEADRIRAEQQAPGARGPQETWQWLPAVLGMPVETDVPAVSRTPVATWALAGVLVAAFLASLLDLGAFVKGLGFIPDRWYRLGGITAATSFFLHGGFLHLAANTYFLLIFGDNVEDRLGPKRFLLLVGASHLAGMLLHGLLEPQGHIPCIGASAGVFGVVAYYAIAFPKARLSFLLWIYVYIRWIEVPAWGMFAFFCVMQLIGAWQQVEGFGNVSHLGHVGGILAGLAAAWWTRSVEPWKDPDAGLVRDGRRSG